MEFQILFYVLFTANEKVISIKSSLTKRKKTNIGERKVNERKSNYLIKSKVVVFLILAFSQCEWHFNHRAHPDGFRICLF